MYPVVDGIYLTGDELPLNKSAHALDVTLMTSIMRDGGGSFSKSSEGLNASQTPSEQCFNSAVIHGSNIIPYPKLQQVHQHLNIFS
jgi:hypothetical protein